MKKLIVFVLSVLCILGLTGCVSDGIDRTNSNNEINETTSEILSAALRFDRKEEIMLFFLSPRRSDEEFEKYIEEKHFRINGIDSKDDVAAVKAELTDVPFPEIRNATITNIYIHHEDDWLFLLYSIGKDEQCSFMIDYSAHAETRAEEENVGLLQDDTSSNELKHDAEKNAYFKIGTVNDCFVVYRYYGSEENASWVLDKETTFSTLIQILGIDAEETPAGELPAQVVCDIPVYNVEIYKPTSDLDWDELYVATVEAPATILRQSKKISDRLSYPIVKFTTVGDAEALQKNIGNNYWLVDVVDGSIRQTYFVGTGKSSYSSSTAYNAVLQGLAHKTSEETPLYLVTSGQFLYFVIGKTAYCIDPFSPEIVPSALPELYLSDEAIKVIKVS